MSYFLLIVLPILIGIVFFGLKAFLRHHDRQLEKVAKNNHILDGITKFHLGDSGMEEVDWAKFEYDIEQVLNGKTVLEDPPKNRNVKALYYDPNNSVVVAHRADVRKFKAMKKRLDAERKQRHRDHLDEIRRRGD